MTPDAVNDWLKTIGKDRKWLALTLKVSIHTLNHQFSKKQFSKRVLFGLERLMGLEWRELPDAIEVRRLFTPEEWDMVERAIALGQFATVDEYITHAALHYAYGILNSPFALKVAESASEDGSSG